MTGKPEVMEGLPTIRPLAYWVLEVERAGANNSLSGPDPDRRNSGVAFLIALIAFVIGIFFLGFMRMRPRLVLSCETSCYYATCGCILLCQ